MLINNSTKSEIAPMQLKYQGATNEYFEVSNYSGLTNDEFESSKDGNLTLLWIVSNYAKLVIDAVDYSFKEDQIICLTELHKVKIVKTGEVRLLRFNRPFYCIQDHDSEVGCNGILFFGASNIPNLVIEGKDKDILITVWKMLIIEMQTRDNLQHEMLQMMLKRILILSTRIYKDQHNIQTLDKENLNLVRSFNYMVEKHFKEKHTVAEYANLLNKSPKTLSNLFKSLDSKTPIQYIQDRIMLEARRLLKYTDKGVSEIGYELGYSDVQSFSRFFKRQEGLSPIEYKNNT